MMSSAPLAAPRGAATFRREAGGEAHAHQALGASPVRRAAAPRRSRALATEHALSSSSPPPLLRACLQFRRGRRRREKSVAAAAASSPTTPPQPPPPPSLEAVRLTAAAGLQRGLRAAAAAAVAAAATNADRSSNPAAAAAPLPALEGRLLPAHLVAAPTSKANNGHPFLLRLMEQRYTIGRKKNHEGEYGGKADGANKTNKTTITVITPHDVDAIFDALEARGCEDGDPYWARVWPSAVALAECLAERPSLVKGKRVADVGAGLGVAGLAAALAGAREVVLLDREPLALECARLSAEVTGGGAFDVARGEETTTGANSASAVVVVAAYAMDGSGSSTSSSSGPLRPLTSIHEVLGEGGTKAATDNADNAPPPRPLVRAVPFDWHARPLPSSLARRFDVVLACDVLYERDAVAPLAEIVPLLMSDATPGGARLLLADPPARTAENRARFLELLGGRGGGGNGASSSSSSSFSQKRFVVDEAVLEQCAPRQLDRELLGGEDGKPVPVQVLLLRAVDSNDTVGLTKAFF